MTTDVICRSAIVYLAFRMTCPDEPAVCCAISSGPSALIGADTSEAQKSIAALEISSAGTAPLPFVDLFSNGGKGHAYTQYFQAIRVCSSHFLHVGLHLDCSISATD